MASLPLSSWLACCVASQPAWPTCLTWATSTATWPRATSWSTATWCVRCLTLGYPEYSRMTQTLHTPPVWVFTLRQALMQRHTHTHTHTHAHPTLICLFCSPTQPHPRTHLVLLWIQRVSSAAWSGSVCLAEHTRWIRINEYHAHQIAPSQLIPVVVVCAQAISYEDKGDKLYL